MAEKVPLEDQPCYKCGEGKRIVKGKKVHSYCQACETKRQNDRPSWRTGEPKKRHRDKPVWNKKKRIALIVERLELAIENLRKV